MIFWWPFEGDVPDYVLHAPVITEEWDHLWLGARRKTNNTAEISAVAEIMLWLLNEAPDNGDCPAKIRFDSFYAANVAQGIWTPISNQELAARTRELVKAVMAKRIIIWEHVYGHTGEHDNELADRAADEGAKGRVSEQSRRWAAPLPPLPE